MTPNRRRFLAPLLALSLAFSVACGSVATTTYNSLASLKGAYQAAKGARTEYCAPKVPQPKICEDSYSPLLAGYQTIVTGEALLETYLLTKDADAKGKLKAYLPVITGQIIEILKLTIGDSAVKPPAR